MAKTKPGKNPVFEGSARIIYRDSLNGDYVIRSSGTRTSGKTAATVVVARNIKTGRYTTEASAKSIDKNVVKYADALRRLANK